MEYGEMIRLEIKSNLKLKELERERFLAETEDITDFVGKVKLRPGEAKRKAKYPLGRIVIPSSVLRKDNALASGTLEEIVIMPKDIEGRKAFIISQSRKKDGDK